jgi:protein ImuB
VHVTGRGLLTGIPAWIGDGADRRRVVAWAGPWVLDERWWLADRVTDPPGYRARLQVVTDRALLVRFGRQGWQLEGVYD